MKIEKDRNKNPWKREDFSWADYNRLKKPNRKYSNSKLGLQERKLENDVA